LSLLARRKGSIESYFHVVDDEGYGKEDTFIGERFYIGQRGGEVCDKNLTFESSVSIARATEDVLKKFNLDDLKLRWLMVTYY